MKKIKVDLLAGTSIGMNQSGMKTQIDTIHNFFKEDPLLDVKKYDMWNYRNPDIVHIFGMDSSMLQILLHLKKRGVKLICSPNHWPNNSIAEKILMNFNYKNIIYSNRTIKKYIVENAEKIIVNSLGEKKHFLKLYSLNDENLEVIPNSYGDEVKDCGSIFLEKYNIEKPYCLMVGMLGVKRKNQLSVLNIWNDSFPNLYILGARDNSRCADECFSIIHKKKNIEYLGYETNFDVIESAYQNAMLLISPGLVETPSLAALRALINGTKVCSTNSYGIPNEYFGDNAFYFDPNDEKSIFNSIKYAVETPLKINQDQLHKFSNNNILFLYKRLYIDVMN